MSKKFHIGVVLSVTTGKLLCPFDELHEFLDYLTGQQLFTHQLSRAADSGAHYIYSLYPELEFIDVPKIEGTSEQREKQVKDFLNYLVTSGIPKEYDLEPMEDFEAKNPIQELIEMRGSDEGIIPVIID
jgi:hypothetical protein